MLISMLWRRLLNTHKRAQLNTTPNRVGCWETTYTPTQLNLKLTTVKGSSRGGDAIFIGLQHPKTQFIHTRTFSLPIVLFNGEHPRPETMNQLAKEQSPKNTYAKIRIDFKQK